MPIDINNINNNTTQTKKLNDSYVKLVGNESGNVSNSVSNNVGKTAQDSVSLTDMSQRIKAMEEQLARLPIIDTQKVEQVKIAINNGSYQFNSDRIAEKLIKFERDLF